MFSNFEIWPINDNKVVKARGRVTVADTIDIHFAIMEGKKGLFASLPGKYIEGKNGKKWYSDVFINDEKVKKEFEQLALKAYEKKISSKKNAEPEDITQEDTDSIPF